MNAVATVLDARNRGEAAREELFGLLLGTAFTFVLFFAMARFENSGSSEPAVEIEDVRLVSLPFDPLPPPPTVERVAAPDMALPFAGLEVAATDSPVSIAVVPPDLESIIPATENPPRALIQFGHVHTELKPRMEIEFDARHVFSEKEVDQVPRALVRTAPQVSRQIINNASSLRVVLLLVIDTKGRVESARISKTSGNAEFDAVVALTVRDEWIFSPAIRRSKKVKCLAAQAIRVNFTSGSMFELR